MSDPRPRQPRAATSRGVFEKAPIFMADDTDRSSRISRRATIGWIAGAGGLLAAGSSAAQPTDPFAGAALYKNVALYDSLGEHRTATAADQATSLWLMKRLADCGMTVSLQPFSSPLFEPRACRIGLAGASIPAFPAWPVVETPAGGLRAPLAPSDVASLAGKIAVVRLPYGRGGAWAAPRFGDPVLSAVKRNAAAVLAVTEGPTGQVIALNAAPDRLNWPVPVVIVGGGAADTLARAASSGSMATLESTGTRTPLAQATNVVARRTGRGKTIVVSTPKSGWFHCAGERGSGIAVFLALADWLVRNTQRDLVFVSTSGHELDEIGGAQFLRTEAPSPQQVALWFHIGANIAVQEVDIVGGQATGKGRAVATRNLTVGADLFSAAQRAFAGEAGYEQPRALDAATAVGELAIYRNAGYEALAGLVGFGPLFHTPLDRADVATTPAILEPVARGARDFLRAAAA